MGRSGARGRAALLGLCRRSRVRPQIREHHRKVRKEAKKRGRKKPRKDPGVPGAAPFKEALLREAELRKQRVTAAGQRVCVSVCVCLCVRACVQLSCTAISLHKSVNGGGRWASRTALTRVLPELALACL